MRFFSILNRVRPLVIQSRHCEHNSCTTLSILIFILFCDIMKNGEIRNAILP